MKQEIMKATEFITQLIKNSRNNTMTENQVKIFQSSMIEVMLKKYKHHWNLSYPIQGSGYRCIRNNKYLDPIITTAAHNANLSVIIIRKALPLELTIWVDPFTVEYRIGEYGSICVLYEAKYNPYPGLIPLNKTILNMLDKTSKQLM